MTDAQLLDAIAVGQMTPGPVFTTATFVGYLLGKMRGAAVATVGIFLPSFFFIAIIGRVSGYLRGSKLFGGFLDGVNAGALALIAVVTFQLGRAALIDTIAWVLALASLIVLVRYKLNSAVLVIAGALVGLIASR
jgi:chromate transporter